MGLGKPHVQGHESRLRPEAKQGEQESDRCPVRREVRTAHRIESELPASALHHPEAEQNGDRPDVRDQQVEKARAADLGKAVLSGHEEVGRQRHGLPRHHECVGVIRQQHETHAGQKQVVLQAHQPRRRCPRRGGSSLPRRRKCPPRWHRAERERGSRAHRAARASADRAVRSAGRPAPKAPRGSSRPPPPGPRHTGRRAEKASARQRRRLIGRSKPCEPDETPKRDERKAGAQR